MTFYYYGVANHTQIMQTDMFSKELILQEASFFIFKALFQNDFDKASEWRAKWGDGIWKPCIQELFLA